MADEERRSLNLDAAALKALAHPLRVRLYDLLSEQGPATATQLADLVGESSGTTSYHLRQLGKHEIIEEVPGHGNRRERWWRRRPGGIRIEGWRYLADPETAGDMRTVGRELLRTYAATLERWYDEAMAWDDDWIQASNDGLIRFDGTVEEMAALRDDVLALVRSYVNRSQDREPPPDSARITVQFHIFPVGMVEGPDPTPG